MVFDNNLYVGVDHPSLRRSSTHLPYYYFIFMIKDFFQEGQEAIMRLRSDYFRVNDYLERGQHHMKLNYFKQGKQHYDFDLNSQEYFHERLDDIVFQKPQIQQDFYEHISKFLQSELHINNETTLASSQIEEECKVNPENSIKMTKHKLIIHFQNRLNALNHKKYLTMLRFHNCIQISPSNLKTLETRIRLIDAEVQSIISRLTRLKTPDQFGLPTNKPIPVNENQSVTYKILDDEQSSYTNISRDDIEIYLRSQGHQYNVLAPFWKQYYSLKHISLKCGLDILEATENSVYEDNQSSCKQVQAWCSRLVSIIEKNAESNKSAQTLSIDSVTTLFQQLYGVSIERPFLLPLTPSLTEELILNINDSMKSYFTSLTADPANLSDLIPKLINFVSIVYRYQNKYVVVEEEQQIRLGLQDDIDLQKQLLTLLELSWVNKYVNLHYSRYNVKMYLSKAEFPQNSFTRRPKPEGDSFIDLATKQIIKATDINNYNVWRGYIKGHSESVIRRAASKFKDFQKCKQYELHSNSDITLSYLNKLYHTKRTLVEPQDKMKKADREIYQSTVEKLSISNPVFVEAYQSLYCLHIRDIKSTLRNILNANRCYFKRLSMDLRILNKIEFKYQCEDNFLVDTNKQERDNIDKLMKRSPEAFTLVSLKRNDEVSNTAEEIEEELSKHSIYSYDKIRKVYFSNEQVPELYVSSTYRSKKYILYQITLKDLSELQDRILETVSKYVSRFQGFVQVNSLEPLVDRYKLLHKLYEWQLKYQYEKFRQVEVLMEIYEHTVDPLNSYKIMLQIFQLMTAIPRIDFNETSFASSYQKETQILREKSRVLEKTKELLQTEEVGEVNQYHSRLSKSINVPYYQYGTYYGDIDTNKQKRQRKESLRSQISFARSSHSDARNRTSSLQLGIQQQNQEGDPDSSKYQEPFDLRNYDEYLLHKDLQQIFDEMAGVRSEMGVVEAREEINDPNKCIHRRVQGGPHFLMRLSEETRIKLLTGNNIQFVNFFQKLCWSINILKLLDESTKRLVQTYCRNSKVLFQLHLERNLLLKSTEILITPPAFKIEKINSEIKWDQSYHFVVKASKKYRQLMKNNLEPPSALMNTFNLPKIIQVLPNFSELQYLDIHSLNCLLTLKKPNNIVKYRELSLAINLMQVFRLTKIIDHAVLEKQMVSDLYKALGKSLSIDVSTNTMESVRQCMLFVQEIKPIHKFGVNFLYPDAVEKLKVVAEAEKTNLHNFMSLVQYHQKRVRTVLLLEKEMRMFVKHKRYYFNGVLDQKRISIDLNNVKSLAARVKPLVGYIGSQFKQLSYLKSKKKMFSVFQEQLSKASLELQQTTEKATRYLNEKKLWLLKQKLIELFVKDMQRTAQKRLQFLEAVEYNQLLSKKVKTLPFNNLFSQQQHTRYLEEKFYYDQKGTHTDITPYENVFQNNLLAKPFYLHTIQQLFSEYSESQINSHLENFNPKRSLQSIQSQIQISREETYKRILASLPLEETQLRGLEYLCDLNRPISGHFSIYQRYRVCKLPPESRQFCAQKKLLEYYHSLNEYINANILQMVLTCENVSLFQEIIDSGKDFDKMYPLIDPTQLYENLESNIIATMYVYEVKQYQILKKAKSSTSQTIVIDQLTDFFIRRVQGLGLIRELFLPFIEELKTFGEKFKNKTQSEVTKFLEVKTRNIYKLIHLGILQTYRNSSDPESCGYLVELYIALFSPYKLPPLRHSDSSTKFDIFSKVYQDPHEHYRFNQKVTFQQDIFSRLHHALTSVPYNLNKYIVDYVSQVDDSYVYSPKPSSSIKPQNFLHSLLLILCRFGESNRLKFVAQIKYLNQNVKEMLVLKKTTDWMSSQQAKQKLLSLDIQTNTLIHSIMGIKDMCTFPLPVSAYNKLYSKYYHEVDTKTIIIVNGYEEYVSSGKLVLTKQEKVMLSTPLPTNTKDWTNRQLDVYRSILKKVVMNKLFKEYFKTTLVSICTDLINKQRVTVNEAVKVVNMNLVPRVKLNSCFSSPLRQEKKTYISNAHKIAFVQAFINRLRNKVSRVDLLSSGYGFVITVADLQNCVNFLNKSLFSFTEKEFKYRMQTFSLYWEMMIESLNLKNKEIIELKTKLKYLKDRVDNINQTAYIKKVSNLLNQNNKLNLKLQQVEKLSQGLEDRTRKVVQIQYHNQLEQLTKQNQILRRKFKEFQELLVMLTKDQTKSSFANLMNEFKTKTSDLLRKNIDLQFSSNFSTPQHTSGTADKSKTQQQPRHKEPFRNLQQDQISSYGTTKILSKMRILNALKIGIEKQKRFKEEERLKKQLAQLRAVHDLSVVKNQKQMLLRKELDNVQIMLSNKIKELDMYKSKCQTLENENDKLRTWKTTKERVIENLKNSVIASQSAAHSQEGAPETRRSETRSSRAVSPKKSLSLHKKEPKQTKDPPSVNTKLFGTQPVFAETSFQLSNKEVAWKQKCEELYIQNKRLQKMIQKMKLEMVSMKSNKTMVPVQEQILNLSEFSRQEFPNQSYHLSYEKTPSNRRKRFPNLSFKYKMNANEL